MLATRRIKASIVGFALLAVAGIGATAAPSPAQQTNDADGVCTVVHVVVNGITVQVCAEDMHW